MKRSALILVICLSMCGLGNVWGQNADSAYVEKQLSKIDLLYDDQKADSAMDLLLLLVDSLRAQAFEAPNLLHFSVWKSLGRGTFELDQEEEAILASKELIQIANKLSPFQEEKYAEAWLYYAQAATFFEQYDLAQQGLAKTDSLLTVYHLDSSVLYGLLLGIQQTFHLDQRNYLQSIEYGNQAIDFYRSQKDSMYRSLFPIYQTQGHNYTDIGQHSKAIAYYEQSNKVADKLWGKDHIYTWQNYNNIGTALNKLGDYEQALLFFETTERIIVEHYGKEVAPLAQIYSNMGVIHLNQNRSVKAISYLKQAIHIYQALYGENHFELGHSYLMLGDVYSDFQEMDSALLYLQKALTVSEVEYGDKHPFLGEIFKSIGSLYRKMDELDLALNYYNKAEHLVLHNYGKIHHDMAQIYTQIGIVYWEQDELEKAIEYFIKSEQLYDLFEIGTNIHLSNSAFKGLCFQELGQWELAEQAYEEAYEYVHFSPDSLFLTSTRSLIKILDILVDHGSLYKERYRQDHLEDHLRTAYEFSEIAMNVLQTIRRDFRKDLEREIWSEGSFHPIEFSLATCHELYLLTDSIRYVQSALRTMELSKNFNLLSAFRGDEAAVFAGVPPETLNQERALRQGIQQLKDQRYEQSQTRSLGKEELRDIDRQIFVAENEHDLFLEQLEKNYPAFFQVKYSNQTVDISEIQSELMADGEMMILYTLIEEDDLCLCSEGGSLNVLTISPSEVSFVQLPIDASFSDSIQSYLLFLNEPQIIPDSGSQAGHYLYDILLARPLKTIHKSAKKLVIVPDGILNYLPFEALPMPDASEDSALLIHHVGTSYAYSATLLQEQQALTAFDAKQFWGGFAADYQDFEPLKPQFEIESHVGDPARSGEFVLPFAQKEVEAIAALTGGKGFYGKKASEKAFKRHAPDYRMLHLSLHTFLNDQNPLQSDLVFTPVTDDDDGYLTTAELYNLKLNAELAVLSACNTGIGQIRRGEGVMSLSRAMAYAGVPATVMSLWKVPDRTTSQIMTSFYAHLKTGRSTDEALRLAKLEYLGSVLEPDERQAYYWAGFIASGKMAVIHFPERNLSWIWLLTVLLLSGGAWGLWTYVRSRQQQSL